MKDPGNIRNCHIHPQMKEDTSEEGTAPGKPVGPCKVVKGIGGDFAYRRGV